MKLTESFNSDITRGGNGWRPFVLERRGLHKGRGRAQKQLLSISGMRMKGLNWERRNLF
jgi:hypothetical protein